MIGREGTEPFSNVKVLARTTMLPLLEIKAVYIGIINAPGWFAAAVVSGVFVAVGRHPQKSTTKIFF
jgi:hypothetical protein